MSTLPAKPLHAKHWHYLYKRRRQRALGINEKQMALSQVISLAGSVAAGVLLETNKTTLALVAGAFVILPGVLDLDGSLGASLSAKINHRLQHESKTGRVFLESVLFAFVVSALAGLLVAGAGATLATIFFDAIFWQVFLLAEGAIVLSALVGFPFIGALSLLFRKLQVNPDDVVGPIESSVFDILTVVTLVLIIGWML